MGMNTFSAVNNVLKEACLRFNCSRVRLERCIEEATDEELDFLYQHFLNKDSKSGLLIINKY